MYNKIQWVDIEATQYMLEARNILLSEELIIWKTYQMVAVDSSSLDICK